MPTKKYTGGCICSCCRENKTQSYFYNGLTVQSGKAVGICKECCKTKLDKYTAIIGLDGAMWSLLGELGVPFIKDKWKSAQQSAKISIGQGNLNVDVIGIYMRLLKESGNIYQGFWDSDTNIEELLEKTVNQTKDDRLDLVLMNKKWGKYDDVKAYTFLEETFNEYTKNLLNMDANLENRYKDLCVAEYAKRKAQESGDIQEISKAQDNLTKQLKLLKLDDFKPESVDEREKFIDRLAWMIEETEPAEEEDLEKYRDIAGFEEAFSQIMRSMRNLLVGNREYPDIPKEEM